MFHGFASTPPLGFTASRIKPLQVLQLTPVCPPLGFSFNLLALLFCAHYLLPRSQAYTSKFFTLQYYNDRTTKYGAGFDDVYYVFLVVVLLTGMRAAAMEYVLAPYSKYMGLRKRKEVTRFSEQAWLVIYCCVFWSIGFVRILCALFSRGPVLIRVALPVQTSC